MKGPLALPAVRPWPNEHFELSQEGYRDKAAILDTLIQSKTVLPSI